ncbi:MAG: UbiD family decarboxylase [Planctomycetota bacterium]|jgi:4-hydroxy-3-polyprenylbenzoate decarboxylase
MPFDHLAEFLDHLSQTGRLERVRAQVSSERELAAIVDRIVHSGAGSTVLFENVDGKSVPVVANLLGTRERLLTALGVDSLNEIADRVTAILRPSVPTDWLQALQLVPKFVAAAEWPPQRVESAVTQQVVLMGSDVDLATLPVPICWPGESLPALTAAQVYLETSETPPDSHGEASDNETQPRQRRLGSQTTVQLLNQNSILIRWTPHDAQWHVVKHAAETGRQLPVAIVLGGDPVLAFATGMPLPDFVDPLVIAGFLRQKSIATAKARSIDIEIPANAEIVLEGLIDPQRTFEPAPPTAAATGFLTDTELAVRATVTAVTHRSNPVLPVIVPGRPPNEAAVLADAADRILLPLVRLAIPELIDLRLPSSGSHRNIAFARIRKQYAQQARKVMNALWGLDRLSTVKLLVVVDEDVDVHNDEDVWFAVGANAHPGRDTIFSEGPTDMFDHAAPQRGIGHRMGIDATRKLANENHPRPWPGRLQTDAETQQLIASRWTEYGLPPGHEP